MATILTGLVRRNIASVFFASGIAQGLSMQSVLRAVVGGGFGFRRTEMIRLYHELEGFAAQFRDIESMYSDKPIPRVRHSWGTFRMTRAVRYSVEVELWDTDKEVAFTRKWGISSNARLSWNDIQTEVKLAIRKAQWETKYEITGMTFEGGWLKPAK